MSSALIDPVALAAVLDGTASSAERQAVMAQLAASDAAVSQFAAAVALHRELTSATHAAADVEAPAATPRSLSEPPFNVPSPRARAGWWRVVLPIALAAAVLTIVLVNRSRQPAGELVLAVARSTRIDGATGPGSLARTLGPSWNDPGWTVTRGNGAARAVTSRAFRAGVRMAQLEVAVQANDSAAHAEAARQVRELIDDIDGAAPVAAQVDAMARAFRPSDAQGRTQLAMQLRELVGAADWFDLGVWTGASQLSAISGQAAAFESRGAGMAALTALLAREVTPEDAWATATAPLRGLPADVAAGRAAIAQVTAILAAVVVSAGG